jgi:hypothetical protein
LEEVTNLREKGQNLVGGNYILNIQTTF